MHAKTMEGLAGASASIQMLSTPMNVAKEAERKGDIDKMKRAMSYAAGLTEQAGEYSQKSSEGMKLDAQEAKKKEEERQEELIRARQKEREELEKRIEEKKQGETKEPESSFDSAEISEEGKQQAEAAVQDSSAAADSTNRTQDVTYDKSGEAAEAVEAIGENVNVSV